MKFIIYFIVAFGAIVGSSSSPLTSLASTLTRETSAGVAPQVSDFQSRHPFLRHKREVDCPIPQYLPQLVQELNTFLPNASSFIGLNQQPAIPVPPADQPALGVCPSETGSWWPGTSENLKSTCPWVYVTQDLGASIYPRYVLSAECVCTDQCIGATPKNSCRKLRTEITVFQRGACRDGLAVMTAVKTHVTSGCYCAGTSTPTPAPPTE